MRLDGIRFTPPRSLELYLLSDRLSYIYRGINLLPAGLPLCRLFPKVFFSDLFYKHFQFARINLQKLRITMKNDEEKWIAREM